MAVVTPGSLGVSEDAVAEAVLPLRRAGFGVRVVSEFIAALPRRARLERVGEVTWLTLERPALHPSKPSKRILDLVAGSVIVVLGAVPFALVLAGRALSGKRILEPEEVLTGRWGERHGVRLLAGQGWLREYPLLGSVLAGRFSLVGPRPLRPGEAVPGGDAWLRIRERHRPGLVGPWSLAPAPSPEEEMQQELRYMEDWSAELDLKLLARVALRRPGGGRGRGSPSPVTRAHSNQERAAAPSPDAPSVGIRT